MLSGPDGGFSITGDYTCTPNTQVYLYALGGNPGAGTNSASGLLAVLGNCPSAGVFSSSTFAWINEVSTIAAAYAMAGFATDATHVSSSGSALAQVGIANAFANAANLASLSTGAALATTPAGNGQVPQAQINTLANILASCVNSSSSGSTTCSTLFSNAMSGGSTGLSAIDTATAAINIAHNTAANVYTLYNLQVASPPFAPTLTYIPYDFSMVLSFTYAPSNSYGRALAIDGAGNAWISDDSGPIVKLASSGAVLSPPSGFIDVNACCGIAIDLAGDAWVENSDNGSITKFSNSGAVLSVISNLPGYGSSIANTIAIDPLNRAWFGDGANTIIELSNSGTVLSGTSGYRAGNVSVPAAIAFDGAGDAWIADGAIPGVVKLSSSGTILSGSTGYSVAPTAGPDAIAIDSSGSVWVASAAANHSPPGGVTKFSNTGSVLVPASATNSNPGLARGAVGIAIDGAGSVWTLPTASSGIAMAELSNAGALLSPAPGYGAGKLYGTQSFALDGSGNLWLLGGYSFAQEIIGIATPVITPIAAGLPLTPTTDGSSNLGTRP